MSCQEQGLIKNRAQKVEKMFGQYKFEDGRFVGKILVEEGFAAGGFTEQALEPRFLEGLILCGRGGD